MEENSSTQSTERRSNGLTYDETVSLVSDVIKQQFQELKSDIKTDNEKTMNLVNRRLDHKKEKIEFKFEGNRRQYDFNSDLIQELQSMKNKVESTSIEELEEMLGDIEKKLVHRNKLIKIADRSEGGWSTVFEYERGDVADNSDDEKKIRRAESRAVKRKKLLPRRSVDQPRQQTTQSQYLFRGPSNEKEENAICWRCGQVGHFRNRCPNNIARAMPQSTNWVPPYQPPVYNSAVPVVWGSGVQKVPETQGVQKRVQ